uniref:Uncharacterized protein n=1 Tax=Sphaerodactylus townsendi TaxID=933632 RepID=A0ACB8EI73_9SAUR
MLTIFTLYPGYQVVLLMRLRMPKITPRGPNTTLNFHCAASTHFWVTATVTCTSDSRREASLLCTALLMFHHPKPAATLSSVCSEQPCYSSSSPFTDPSPAIISPPFFGRPVPLHSFKRVSTERNL